MQSFFDRPIDRRSSLSVKWNKQAIKSQCGNPEAEPFWVADMDYQVADAIADQARQLSEHAIYGYPMATGQRELFCNWAEKRHQMHINTADVVICQGVLSSIAVLVEQLTAENDGVIVVYPAYQPFARIVNNLGRTLLSWPLLYDAETHRFGIDWKTYEDLCAKAKVLLFCNPHNPSGLAFTPEELEKLARIAKEHNVVIISDEIHADLSFGPHTSLHQIAKKTGCRTVVCMAPSKTFNIAGEHYSATLFSDQELRIQFKKRLEQLFIVETSTFATTLAMAAYREGLPWLNELIAYLKGNRDLIETTLKRELPSLVFIPPKASFIGLFDCSKVLDLVREDAKANPQLYDPSLSPQGGLLSRFFGQRAQVACNDGTWFGGPAYEQFVRFNYGTQRDAVERALSRMIKAVRWLEETYRR